MSSHHHRMGADPEWGVNQYDASVSRVRGAAQTAEAGRWHAMALAKDFTTCEERSRVLEVLDDVVGRDTHVALPETSLLSAVGDSL